MFGSHLIPHIQLLFSSQDATMSQFLKHAEDAVFPLICKQCERSPKFYRLEPYGSSRPDLPLFSVEKLKEHVCHVHLQYAPYGCLRCNEWFAMESELYKHQCPFRTRYKNDELVGLNEWESQYLVSFTLKISTPTTVYAFRSRRTAVRERRTS